MIRRSERRLGEWLQGWGRHWWFEHRVEEPPAAVSNWLQDLIHLLLQHILPEHQPQLDNHAGHDHIVDLWRGISMNLLMPEYVIIAFFLQPVGLKSMKKKSPEIRIHNFGITWNNNTDFVIPCMTNGHWPWTRHTLHISLALCGNSFSQIWRPGRVESSHDSALLLFLLSRRSRERKEKDKSTFLGLEVLRVKKQNYKSSSNGLTVVVVASCWAFQTTFKCQIIPKHSRNLGQ